MRRKVRFQKLETGQETRPTAQAREITSSPMAGAGADREVAAQANLASQRLTQEEREGLRRHWAKRPLPLVAALVVLALVLVTGTAPASA